MGGGEDPPTAISGPDDLDNFNFLFRCVKWLITSPAQLSPSVSETLVAQTYQFSLLLTICLLVKQSFFLGEDHNFEVKFSDL